MCKEGTAYSGPRTGMDIGEELYSLRGAFRGGQTFLSPDFLRTARMFGQMPPMSPVLLTMVTTGRAQVL